MRDSNGGKKRCWTEKDIKRSYCMDMYIDKKDLAKFLKIPVTSVDYYRRMKGMPCIKIGKHHRYVLSEVINWLQKSRAS